MATELLGYASFPPAIPRRVPNCRTSAALGAGWGFPSRAAPSSSSRAAPGRSVGASTLDKPRPLSQDTGARRQPVVYHNIHHVGLLVENLERSLAFYQDVLGMEVRKGRPHKQLPYRGEWLAIGDEMIHLMELPNPDPREGRPKHGGRDRHFCLSVASVAPLEARLKAANWEYTASASGRAAVFFRDPDFNVLECAENGTGARS